MSKLNAKLMYGTQLFLIFEKEGVKVAVQFSQLETQKIKEVFK